MASAENKRKVQSAEEKKHSKKASKEIKLKYKDDDDEEVTRSFSLTRFEKKYLINRDEKLTEKNEIYIMLDYPLSKEFIFKVDSKDEKGFTIGSFCDAVIRLYKQVYKEEHDEVGDPGHVAGMLNRKESNGKYGIWGHDIGDLFLEGIIKRDKTHFELIMGS